MTTTATFIAADPRTIASQIGQWTVMSISGGRVIARPTGVTLPVSNGYSVTVDLAGDDTYTVRRILKRGAKTWVKGEEIGVYCDHLEDSAYRASCFRNVDVGAHQP